MSIISRILYKLRKLPHRGFAPPEADFSICLCGDFMLDSRIEPYLQKYGLTYPFQNLLPTLLEYDIRALNLETPISDLDGEKWPDKKFNFKGASYLAQMLGRVGFDYVSLSNNHIMDYGKEVMSDTMKNLDKWGIRHSGTNSRRKTPHFTFVCNGKKIAFLSFMDLPAELLPGGFSDYCEVYDENALKKIMVAKRSTDIVIVSIHWGTELDTRANIRQRKNGREIIDAGATVVWGHHPHVIQEIETYKKGVIFYSLGNFIFSHLTPKIKTGLIAGLHFKSGKIILISEHKINIDNYRVLFAPRIKETKEISLSFGK